MDRYLFDASVNVKYERYSDTLALWRLFPSVADAREAIADYLRTYAEHYEGYDGESPLWFECTISDSCDKYGGYPDRTTFLRFYYRNGKFYESLEAVQKAIKKGSRVA